MIQPSPLSALGGIRLKLPLPFLTFHCLSCIYCSAMYSQSFVFHGIHNSSGRSIAVNVVKRDNLWSLANQGCLLDVRLCHVLGRIALQSPLARSRHVRAGAKGEHRLCQQIWSFNCSKNSDQQPLYSPQASCRRPRCSFCSWRCSPSIMVRSRLQATLAAFSHTYSPSQTFLD